MSRPRNFDVSQSGLGSGCWGPFFRSLCALLLLALYGGPELGRASQGDHAIISSPKHSPFQPPSSSFPSYWVPLSSRYRGPEARHS